MWGIAGVTVGTSAVARVTVPTPAIWSLGEQAAPDVVPVEIAHAAALALGGALAARHAPAVPLLVEIEIANVPCPVR
jgi:hypothetical protein